MVVTVQSAMGRLDVTSTHDPSTHSPFFSLGVTIDPQRAVKKRSAVNDPPPLATTNRFLAEPGGGPWVNCAWVEVSRGRFVGGRIIKAPAMPAVQPCQWASAAVSVELAVSGFSWPW
jgi:hypothetical protein